MHARITLLLALLLGAAPAALAQTVLSDNANASVTARVVSDISVTKDADVSFGNVPDNSTPILDPNDPTGASTDVGGAAQVGEFSIGGSQGAVVIVTFGSATLSDGASHTMTFTPKVVGHANAANQSSAPQILNNGEITLGASGYHVWLGGNLGTLSDQEPGLYTGTFTLTAEYK